MSDDNKVFDAPPNTNNGEPPAPPAFQIPDPVKDFVGEGKKYATVEEALKSIPHAQKHIESLKQAADAAKAEAERLKAERETYEAFMREQQNQNTNSAPLELDPTQVENLVKRTLEQEKRDATAKANLLKVREDLTKRFGDKAGEIFNARGKELGVDINALAMTSPQAVLELFPKAKEADPNTSGSVNTAALPRFARPPEQKPVMFGSSTEDLVQAWRNAKPQ